MSLEMIADVTNRPSRKEWIPVVLGHSAFPLRLCLRHEVSLLIRVESWEEERAGSWQMWRAHLALGAAQREAAVIRSVEAKKKAACCQRGLWVGPRVDLPRLQQAAWLSNWAPGGQKGGGQPAQHGPDAWKSRRVSLHLDHPQPVSS